MKYFTVTRSEEIVSPTAHKLWDLTAGHCNVNVRLHTPFSSRKRPAEDSVPAMGLTTNLVGLELDALEFGCRSGVDSEAIVREEERAVSGVMEKVEEEREGVDDNASNGGSS